MTEIFQSMITAVPDYDILEHVDQQLGDTILSS
jgi:hypothetical protein